MISNLARTARYNQWINRWSLEKAIPLIALEMREERPDSDFSFIVLFW